VVYIYIIINHIYLSIWWQTMDTANYGHSNWGWQPKIRVNDSILVLWGWFDLIETLSKNLKILIKKFPYILD